MRSLKEIYDRVADYYLGTLGFGPANACLNPEKIKGGWKVPLVISLDIPRFNWSRQQVLSFGTDKIKHDSLYSGFQCGKIILDEDLNIKKGLNKNEVLLMRYARRANICAFEIEKGNERFACFYPHQFGNVMIERLWKIEGIKSPLEKGDMQRRIILLGKSKVEVIDYEGIFVFWTTYDKFVNVLSLSKEQVLDFKLFKNPAVFVAFNKAIYLFQSFNRFYNEDIVEKNVNVRLNLFNEFERIKKLFLGGKRLKPENGYEFKYTERMGNLKIKQVVLNKLDIKGLLDHQLTLLLSSLVNSGVTGFYHGKRFRGRIIRPDPIVYDPEWPGDNFENALALTHYDIELAKELTLTGLYYFIVKDGSQKGMIPCVHRALDRTIYPIWTFVTWYIYHQSKDKKWLALAYEPLKDNDYYWDSHHKGEKGLYRGGCFALDWCGNPLWIDGKTGRGIEGIYGIATNSYMYLHKNIMSNIAKKLGYEKEDKIFRESATSLRDKINSLFWSEESGFYFDYDSKTNSVYKEDTKKFSKVGEHYGVDNLIPLFAGVPDYSRAKMMLKIIRNPNLYAKYKAIPNEITDTFMHGYRLYVWAWPNWTTLQGLRMYGFHKDADRLSNNLFNMVYSSWSKYKNLPECFDARHGYEPEENSNVGGNGSAILPMQLIRDRLGFYWSNLEDMGIKVFNRRKVPNSVKKVIDKRTGQIQLFRNMMRS